MDRVVSMMRSPKPLGSFRATGYPATEEAVLTCPRHEVGGAAPRLVAKCSSPATLRMNSVKTPDVAKVDAAVHARMQDSLDDLEPYSAGFPSTMAGMRR